MAKVTFIKKYKSYTPGMVVDLSPNETRLFLALKIVEECGEGLPVTASIKSAPNNTAIKKAPVTKAKKA